MENKSSDAETRASSNFSRPGSSVWLPEHIRAVAAINGIGVIQFPCSTTRDFKTFLQTSLEWLHLAEMEELYHGRSLPVAAWWTEDFLEADISQWTTLLFPSCGIPDWLSEKLQTAEYFCVVPGLTHTQLLQILPSHVGSVVARTDSKLGTTLVDIPTVPTAKTTSSSTSSDSPLTDSTKSDPPLRGPIFSFHLHKERPVTPYPTAWEIIDAYNRLNSNKKAEWGMKIIRQQLKNHYFNTNEEQIRVIDLAMYQLDQLLMRPRSSEPSTVTWSLANGWQLKA